MSIHWTWSIANKWKGFFLIFMRLSDSQPARERYLQLSSGCLSRKHYLLTARVEKGKLFRAGREWGAMGGLHSWAKSTFWEREWKKANFLGLEGNEKEQWVAYTAGLKVSHVWLKETEDELIWLKDPNLGFSSPRLGFKVMFVNDQPNGSNGGGNHFGKSGPH